MTAVRSAPSARWLDALGAAKRALVLDAARAEFAEHGLEGATMRRIATRAGVTTGAVYPLFASKEAIYAELLEQSLATLAEAVSAAAAAPPRGRLAHEAAAAAFLDHYLAHPFEVNLGLYAFHGLKRQGVGAALDDALNERLAATVRLLSPRDHGPRRRPGPPDAEAMLVFAQLIGLLVLELAGRLRIGRATPHGLLAAARGRRRRTPTGDPP